MYALESKSAFARVVALGPIVTQVKPTTSRPGPPRKKSLMQSPRPERWRGNVNRSSSRAGSVGS